MIVTPLGTVWRFAQDSDDRARSQCQTRVNTRDDLRLVLGSIFDYFDRDGPSPAVTDLRQILDTTYPAITLDDCLAGVA